MSNFNIVPSDTPVASLAFPGKHEFVNKNGQPIKPDHPGPIYQIINQKENPYSPFKLLVRKICYSVLMFFSNKYLGRYQCVQELAKLTSTTYEGIQLDAERERIVKDYTPQMVRALGGIETVFKYIKPLKEDWQGDTSKKFDSHIMRGYWSAQNQPCLLFSYNIFDPNKRQSTCWTQEKVYEVITLSTDKKTWTSLNNSMLTNQLALGRVDIAVGSEAEKFFLDRIKRLRTGSPLGCTKYLSKDVSLPKDAYLENEELQSFIKARFSDSASNDFRNYERKPEEGTTDIALPIGNEALLKRFPNQRLSS